MGKWVGEYDLCLYVRIFSLYVLSGYWCVSVGEVVPGQHELLGGKCEGKHYYLREGRFFGGEWH